MSTDTLTRDDIDRKALGLAPAQDSVARVEATPATTRGTRPQFAVECASLARALAYVGKALPGTSAAPVLNGVMLTADAGTDTLTLTCTDGEHARTATIDARVLDSGSVLVGADLLIQIAKLLAKGPIVFSDDGRALHVVWNATNYWLPTLPELDFPALAQLPPVIGTVDVATLTAVLARVKPTIGTPSAKDHIPGFEGVYFTPVGDTLTLTATDRHRASLVDVAWSNTSGCATPFNVPGRKLVEALDAFTRELGKAGGTVELRQGDGWFALVSGRYALSIPTLTSGVHAGLSSVFNATRAAHATCNAAELSKAIETVSKIAGKKWPVRLVWTAETVSVESADSECPASIAVPCQFAGVHGFNVHVLPDHIKQGLTAVKARSPLFAFRTSNAAFELSAPTLAGDTFRYVVMPIRQTGTSDVDAHDPGSTVVVTPTPEPVKAPPRARKATRAPKDTPASDARPVPVEPDPWAELGAQLGIAPAYA